MKIYVGNLPHEVTEQGLREEFTTFGEVASVNIITDRYSGRPRGFGFVEMALVSQGQAAINGLNGNVLKAQMLKVSAARPPSDNRGGGSHGNRRSGGPNRGWQREGISLLLVHSCLRHKIYVDKSTKRSIN